MKKLIKINGMSCGHCVKRVEAALSSLGFSKVSVELDSGTALVEAPAEITDESIKNAVEDLGFELVGIEIR